MDDEREVSMCDICKMSTSFYNRTEKEKVFDGRKRRR